jgi:hypothetical protein
MSKTHFRIDSVDNGTHPNIPDGWVAEPLGPDLDATPRTRSIRRRGGRRDGTVSALQAEQVYPDLWAVYDPERVEILLMDADRIPAGSEPVSLYGHFAHTFTRAERRQKRTRHDGLDVLDGSDDCDDEDFGLDAAALTAAVYADLAAGGHDTVAEQPAYAAH